MKASRILRISITAWSAVVAMGALADNYLPSITVLGSRVGDALGASRLSSEHIETRQADNVGTLLNVLPGVNMGGTARPSGQTLNVWGLGDEEDIAISLDGAPKNFEKYQQGTVFVEPELLKRVNVDKGSFDVSRAGSPAGAVQLETRSASDFMGSRTGFGAYLKSAYHTNDHQQQYTGALMWRSDRADVLLALSRRVGKDIHMPSGDPFLFSANSQRSVLLKSNIDVSEHSRLTLSFVEGQHTGWEPWAAKSGNALSAPSEADIRRYGLDEAWKRKLVYRQQSDRSASVRYRLATTASSDWETTLSYSRTRQHDTRSEHASKYLAASMGNESWTSYRNLGLDSRYRMQFSTGQLEHETLIGVSANTLNREVLMFDAGKTKKADYHYGYYSPYYMPSGKQVRWSMYASDTISWHRWTGSLGLRYDHYRNEGQRNLASIYNSMLPTAGHDYRPKVYAGWSPYLGLKYQLTPQLALFANVSKTWRSPVIDELYEVQSASSRISGTSRDLRPERVLSQRYGLSSNFSHLLKSSDRLSVRALVFSLIGKDEVFKTRGIACEATLNNASGNAVCQKPIANNRNLPGYDIQGFELEAYYDSPTWLASLSYSIAYGHWYSSPRNPYLKQRAWLTSVPPQKAVLSLGYQFQSFGLLLGWRGEFVGSQPYSVKDTDPDAAYWALPKTTGYALHGLYAVYRPKSLSSLSVQLTIDNLFNRDYRPYLSERVSQVGRNFKASMSYQF